jgi:tryptophan halogenase
LQEQLEIWRQFSPVDGDFISKLEIFNTENFLYVLYGMDYTTTTSALSKYDCVQSSRWAKTAQLRSEQLLKELPGHRALLEKISKYGLQKV